MLMEFEYFFQIWRSIRIRSPTKRHENDSPTISRHSSPDPFIRFLCALIYVSRRRQHPLSRSLSLGAEICLSQRSSYPKSHDWNRRNPFTGVPVPTFRKWNTKSIHHLHIYLLFIYSLCRIRCSSSSSDSRSGVDPAWKWLQKVPNKPFRNILTSKIATNQQAMNFWRCSQLCMQTWLNLQHARTHVACCDTGSTGGATGATELASGAGNRPWMDILERESEQFRRGFWWKI